MVVFDSIIVLSCLVLLGSSSLYWRGKSRSHQQRHHVLKRAYSQQKNHTDNQIAIKQALEKFPALYPLLKDKIPHFAPPEVPSSEQSSTQETFLALGQAQQHILDGIRTAVAVFDKEGRLQFCNPAFFSLWKTDPNSFPSGIDHGNLLEDLRARRKLPEQSDFKTWKNHQLSVYHTAISRQDDVWHLPDERTIRVLTQRNPVGGAIVFFEDITQQVTLERSLNGMTGSVKRTLDALEEGVASFGADGILRVANPAFLKIWGLPEDILENQNFHIRQISSYYQKGSLAFVLWQKIALSLTANMKRDPLKETFENAQKQVYDISLTPLPTGDMLLTCVDKTAQNRIEVALQDRAKALEAADHMKQRFLSHVSYELRNPLTAIMGFTQLLQMQLAEDKLTTKQQEYVGDLQQASHQLMNLIDSILEMAQVDFQSSPNLAIIQSDLLLTNVCHVLASQAVEAGVRVEMEQNETITFFAEDSFLKQALVQLGLHSLRHTPKGGQLVFSVRTEGDNIIFHVKDNGFAMNQDHIALALQQPFQSSQEMTRAKRDGASLELAFARQVLQRYNGQLSILSTDEGVETLLSFPRNLYSTSHEFAVRQSLA